MQPIFDHEKLVVYQESLGFSSWVSVLVDKLTGKHSSARQQLLRASQSVALNIAEGNGKRSRPDRNRFPDISRGSALECAAILDVLRVSGAVSEDEAREGKEMLRGIVAMLTKLIQVNAAVMEDVVEYGQVVGIGGPSGDGME